MVFVEFEKILVFLKNVKVAVEEVFIAPVIYMDAQRRKKTNRLYSLKSNDCERFTARLIPYFTIANREECDLIICAQVK